MTVEVGVNRKRIMEGQTVEVRWTVTGEFQSLKLDPAPGAPSGFDAANLPFQANRTPSGSVTLKIGADDCAGDRTLTFTVTAEPKGGGAPVTGSASVEVAPPLDHKLRCIALDRGCLDEWMSKADAQPFKVGSPAGDAIRCIRLALFWNGNKDVSARNDYNSDLAKYVKEFQQAQLNGPDGPFSALGRKKEDLVANGELDRLTAALLDQALLDRKDVPDAAHYWAPAKVANPASPAFSADPMSERSLPGRCIKVLDYWASQGVKYVKETSFAAGVAFGGDWRFAGSGTPQQNAAWATNCSSSTVTAFFWGTHGKVGDVDFVLSDSGPYYQGWQITGARSDTPDGAAGVVVQLGLGKKIELSVAEQQAADDEVDAEVEEQVKKSKKAISAAEKTARKKERRLQKLVNKLQKGDCVQGWVHEDSPALTTLQRNSGHSFFIVDVTRSGDNVTEFTILTANTDAGVSREARKWNNWEDLRIARFHAIEGE